MSTSRRTEVKKILILLFVFILVGCGTTEYRDRYTAIELDQSLTKDYDVPPPPSSAVTYSFMDWDQKESMWTDYTNNLIEVIGKHQADKAGLRKANSEYKIKVEELNKKADKK